MLKLVCRLLIFCLLIFLSSLLISKFIYKPLQLLPYSYASDVIYFKNYYLENHPSKFNAAFIGSSHVYRQFHPALFDSIVGNSIHSYNYGVQGLGATELIYLGDHLIKEKLPLKYLFLEISTITFPDHVNLHTTRMFYWYSRSTFYFTMKALFDSRSNSFIKKCAMATMHSIGLIDKELNFGFVSDLNTFYYRNRDAKKRMNVYGDLFTGYAPRQRTFPIKSDIKGINLRKEGSAQQYEKFEQHPALLENYNKTYVSEINSLINRYAKQGVYAVIVFAPRANKSEYDEFIPLLSHIDKKHKIELADSRKYPEFYSLENSADETHLNKKGSQIFTKELAKEFKKIMNEN